jgi:hypothetical protein
MDIPNLAPNPTIINDNTASLLKLPQKSKKVYIIIVFLAIIFGFWISRFLPTRIAVNETDGGIKNKEATKIIEGKQVETGVLYGNLSQNFKDSATGTIKAGGVNGEGTHTLLREGGVTQNAALTSSVVDLDLFIDKKVEVKGETNDSNKAGWFMDVGSIKILE